MLYTQNKQLIRLVCKRAGSYTITLSLMRSNCVKVTAECKFEEDDSAKLMILLSPTIQDIVLL